MKKSLLFIVCVFVGTIQAVNFNDHYKNSSFYEKPVKTNSGNLQPSLNGQVDNEDKTGANAGSGYQKFSQSELERKELQNKITQMQERIARESKQNKKLYSRTRYSKGSKDIHIKKNPAWVNIYIPYNDISDIVFDKEIKDIEFLGVDGVNIAWEKDSTEDETRRTIKITNKSSNFELRLEVILIDESVVNLIVAVGNSSKRRYTKYNVFTNQHSLNALTSLKKQLNIENTHNYYNMVGIKLILDRITESGIDYKILKKNSILVNKVLFNDVAWVKGLTGDKLINYSLRLHTTYETQYAIDKDIDGIRTKKRIVMLELIIKNKDEVETLTITPQLIKKRFSNYIAFYYGDIDNDEHIILPGKEAPILIVMEDKEEVE
jgi:hypothetical protein